MASPTQPPRCPSAERSDTSVLTVSELRPVTISCCDRTTVPRAGPLIPMIHSLRRPKPASPTRLPTPASPPRRLLPGAWRVLTPAVCPPPPTGSPTVARGLDRIRSCDFPASKSPRPLPACSRSPGLGAGLRRAPQISVILIPCELVTCSVIPGLLLRGTQEGHSAGGG